MGGTAPVAGIGATSEGDGGRAAGAEPACGNPAANAGAVANPAMHANASAVATNDTARRALARCSVDTLCAKGPRRIMPLRYLPA